MWHCSRNSSVLSMKVIIVLSCFILGAFSSTKLDSNRYLDNLLQVPYPQYVRALGLTSINLSGFQLKVKKTSLSNRDLKAEFHNGKLTHPTLTRLGDCSAPGWQGTNVTLGCYLSLGSLRVEYNGTAKGDNVLATNKSIDLTAFFMGSKAFLEVTSAPGSVPTLKTWSVLPLNTQLFFSKKLDLNASRQTAFETEVKRNVVSATLSALYGGIQHALTSAVGVTKTPLP
ncbi:uncharacterized protein LOC135372795 [Ornithodoros turicata]|uniref:uncharacterized protein LOC135372795 n=1 Tax=Ornithodoros turicata TaxID=34597 RepID=UPI0031387986